ncbi:PREDICTED: cellular tumor antigen p53 [Cyphomyrmex costatus]|uniref:Tumor protein 63 n=1 Tax=Cyphomyrmex costatus TaxID=456900 RepID=A0A195C1G0_9HYME|nr:PREDICTED: cellular tumor antigen p53 [Cyphomyrmex costatus]KYM94450.1 Tumor protein 63 [Cyphomyrmex costatus]
MLGVNVVSDSQESALMDDETYKDIEKTFGGTLPLPEDMNEFEILEDNKYPIFTQSTDISPEKKLKSQTEEEIYYPYLYTNYLCTLNFQYTLAENGGQDWVYSQILKKAYVKMEKTLPLRFTWEPTTSGLFLRTKLVFVYEQHKNDPVRRCPNHIASTSYNNELVDPERKHVVYCVNHAASTYEEENEHLSILTPLRTPEPGSQYVAMCFKFFCKNSCPSGMNRRETELEFTLEDKRKKILARQTLGIRICSCPKRDKIKGENDLERSISVKREIALTSGKKIPSYDTHVYKVELDIVGKENYLSVYKHAYDIMAGQAARTGQHECFKPYMDEISRKVPLNH